MASDLYKSETNGYRDVNSINSGGSVDISACAYPDDVHPENVLNLLSYGKLKVIPGDKKYQVLKLKSDKCGIGELKLRAGLSKTELKNAVLQPFFGQNMIDLPDQFFRVVPADESTWGAQVWK